MAARKARPAGTCAPGRSCPSGRTPLSDEDAKPPPTRGLSSACRAQPPAAAACAQTPQALSHPGMPWPACIHGKEPALHATGKGTAARRPGMAMPPAPRKRARRTGPDSGRAAIPVRAPEPAPMRALLPRPIPPALAESRPGQLAAGAASSVSPEARDRAVYRGYPPRFLPPHGEIPQARPRRGERDLPPHRCP